MKSLRAVLPTKLSAVTRVALEDLKKVEKSKNFVVNMGTWVNKRFVWDNKVKEDRKVCEVCFAGSVMAKEFGVEDIYTPGYLSDTVHKKDIDAFYALNCMRLGNVTGALSTMDKPDFMIKKVGLIPDEVMKIPNYGKSAKSRKKFRKAMFRLVHAMEKVGL